MQRMTFADAIIDDLCHALRNDDSVSLIGGGAQHSTSPQALLWNSPACHRVDQPLVTRHVDEAKHVAIGHRRIGVAEFDGDTARLLFLETIGIHTG